MDFFRAFPQNPTVYPLVMKHGACVIQRSFNVRVYVLI